MEEKKLTALNLKIPADIHQLLKIYAAKNSVSLVKTAEKLICEAIKELNKNANS